MPKNYEVIELDNPHSSDLRLEEFVNLPCPALKSYFGIVRDGNWEHYRSHFGGKRTPTSKILSEWMPILESIREKYPSLWAFENDLASKVGPLSFMKPLAERYEDIEAYYTLIHSPAERVDRSALEAVLREWNPVRGICINTQDRTWEQMKKSTSAGLPYYTKKRNLTPSQIKPVDCFSSTYMDGTTDTDLNIDGQWWSTAAILGWRGQEGGPKPEDVKQRVVWMFPNGVNLRELQFYQPAIAAAQQYNLVPAWVSNDAVDRAITKLFDTKGKDDPIVCTDFSKFDQHFNTHCQNGAEYIIRGLLSTRQDSLSWLAKVFPIKYNIPLLVDEKHLYSGRHGMGSGSGGTNFDETVLHRALQYEAAQRAGERLNPYSQCLGDDGILTFPGITVDKVIDAYTSHGLEMNPTKQYVSTQDCTYLRKWHHRDYRMGGVCVGVYATTRALGRLCEQERYYDPEIWSNKMETLRFLSILENVKWHPLRDQFAQFCMERDKYRLGLDIPGFYDNLEKLAAEATDLMPDFLGYTRSLQGAPERGIKDWWIVNFVQSQRRSSRN